MRRRTPMILLTLALLVCSGCGFTPLYGARDSAGIPVGARQVQSIALDPIPGRGGQILRNALEDALHLGGREEAAHYRLNVTFEIKKIPVIIQDDASISRYNMLLVSRYRLMRAADEAVIDSGEIKRMGSYNVSDADFSSYTAEQDTIKRNILELAEEYRLRLSALLAGLPAS